MNKAKLKQSYIEFMTSLQVTKMLTVTFKYNFSDKDCLNYLNTSLHFINGYLYGNSYRRHKNKFMQGIVVFERHKSGMPHFHILITKDDELVLSDSEVIRRIKKAFKAIKYYGHNRRYDVFDPVGVDMRDAETDTGKLAKYLTKEGYHDHFHNISFLTAEKVVYDFI